MASIKKLPSGAWRALVRIKGYPPQSGTFRTKAQAERWAISTEDQIRSGSFRDTSVAENRLLIDHLAWYLEALTPRKAPSALKRETSRIRILLIGMRPDSVTQAFNRACKRLGISDLRIHDLRHEATSRFFERGFSIPEVALITGHSDWASLKRYTQLRPQDLVDKLQGNQSN